MAIKHAYTASIADETRTAVVHPADWLSDHAIASGTALNGLAPVGAVAPFAGLVGSVPSGWLLCNGDGFDRVGTYAGLYAVIGTIYGAPDGDHFSVPDLRDKFIVGAVQDSGGVPKASVTGGLAQSYAPASWNLTHSLTIAAHTGITHGGLALGDQTAAHSAALADHPTLQLAGTIADQGTVGRQGTRTASAVVSDGAHAVTWPSINTWGHTVTQIASHNLTHAVTQASDHGAAGSITHSFTPPAANTLAATGVVPAFLAIGYMIRYL